MTTAGWESELESKLLAGVKDIVVTELESLVTNGDFSSITTVVVTDVVSAIGPVVEGIVSAEIAKVLDSQASGFENLVNTIGTPVKTVVADILEAIGSTNGNITNAIGNIAGNITGDVVAAIKSLIP